MTDAWPANFLWGASTSAHQVEGGNHNDWSEWEKSHASYLARTARERLRDQSRFIGILPDQWESLLNEASQASNYLSGNAADHYRRFGEDFDIAKQLGHTAHRFSIEWSRIEPTAGHINQREIAHYREVIMALRQRNIEPLVTLWHWTLPTWVARQGGFANKKTIADFNRYVETIVTALGNDVNFWITLNEPMVYAATSYFQGYWPPQIKNPLTYYRVVNHLIQAHRLAYRTIKDINPAAQIGIAKNNIAFQVANRWPDNLLLAYTADWWWNRRFLRAIRRCQDFIGLNNYGRNVINHGYNKNPHQHTSDMGWELYPSALYETLQPLRAYGVPIYITEHGLADADDSRRAWFIAESLAGVRRALAEGVDVRGYLHWSLLDNFEWDKGFWPRFGLVAIDYATQHRTIRSSAETLSEIMRGAVGSNTRTSVN